MSNKGKCNVPLFSVKWIDLKSDETFAQYCLKSQTFIYSSPRQDNKAVPTVRQHGLSVLFCKQSLWFLITIGVTEKGSIDFKHRRILRPGIPIQLKFAASTIICVWTYEKLPQIIWYLPSSYTYIRRIIQIFVKANQMNSNNFCFWPFVDQSRKIILL